MDRELAMRDTAKERESKKRETEKERKREREREGKEESRKRRIGKGRAGERQETKINVQFVRGRLCDTLL